jgi:hypothetical protein
MMAGKFQVVCTKRMMIKTLTLYSKYKAIIAWAISLDPGFLPADQDLHF